MNLSNRIRFQVALVAVLAAAATSPGLRAQAPARAASVPDDLIKKVGASVDAAGARLQRIFKDIHQNPELGFMETRTAGVVEKELRVPETVDCQSSARPIRSSSVQNWFEELKRLVPTD